MASIKITLANTQNTIRRDKRDSGNLSSVLKKRKSAMVIRLQQPLSPGPNAVPA
jgi:hypothetical protein